MSRVVMIFLDAFSSRYLTDENTPFLNKIAQRGFCTPLKPMFAMGTALSASIYSGTLPNTNKIWCDYVVSNTPSSRPKMFKYLIKLSDFIPSDNLNKYVRYFLYKIFNQKTGTPNVIPSNFLDFFELKKESTESNSLGEIVTLFDVLKNHNMEYCVSGLSASIFDPSDRSILKALKGDYDLFSVKFSSLDKLGHKRGPESKKVHKRVLDIDNILRDVVESESMKDTYFVFFSDHGMSPVFDTINLFNMLDKLSVKMPEDYLLFLHSTVACFWFKSEKAKKIISEILENVEFGNILDKPKLKELGIDKIGFEYGELIFALKEGYVFFPDFYRKNTVPKGMHGYAYPTYDTPILIIYLFNSLANIEKREIVQHVDIVPTVLDLLGLPIPSTCDGKSLIRKKHITR